MPLPELREELRIEEAANDWDGSPCWLIHDLPAHRFHRIGWLEFEILVRWGLADPQKIIASIRSETTLKPTEEDLHGLLIFLEQNNLLRITSMEGSARLSARNRNSRKSPEQWLLHNYLFFRIPLLKPDNFLNRLMPLAAPLLTRNALIFFMTIAVIGLYLAARQWDVFSGNFVNTLTPNGYISYIVAIIIAKCTHELGHALLAKKAGIRIPRMGIAFLVMFPVLYTDLGEGWLLHDYRLRRLVSAGGMLAEGALAAAALFMWGMLPEGAFRNACYILAVVSIGRSILINISPFMRFDGYYLLSDHFNIPNLQQRAFEFTRHKIRRIIFASNEEPPEHLPGRLSYFFVSYSLLTWIYRFVVFLSIALMVYHFFFKTLGIFLMMVELLYFILFPIVRELLVWRKQMSQVSSTRYAALIVPVLLVLLLLAIPWQSKLTLPAILTARMKQPIYSPFAARIATVPSGNKEYKAGERLFTLDAEEARFQLKLARIQIQELRSRLELLPAETKGLEQASIWREQLLEREQAARAQLEELKRLVLYAEHDGVMVDMDEGVKTGSYVSYRTLLGILVNKSSTEIEAYADQNAVERIKPGTIVTFYSNAKVNKALTGQVISSDYSRMTSLPTPALADRNGGTIATLTTPDNHLVPKESLFRVRIKLDAPIDSSRIEIGTVIAKVAPESFAGRFTRFFLSVLIRESGF